MCMGCWGAYVVPVESSTMASWHHIVLYFLYSITYVYVPGFSMGRNFVTTDLVPGISLG